MDSELMNMDKKEFQCKFSCLSHTQSISSIKFQSKGKFLATTGLDRLIKLWNYGWKVTKLLLLGLKNQMFN